MFTYVLMGLPFILLTIVLDMWILKTHVIKTRQCWGVMVFLMVLTAIFDQFLTGAPVVTYNEATMTNIRLGYAPIEDFMYTFSAVIGIGSVWSFYEKE